MQFNYAQRGSAERVLASFFITENVWFEGAGTHNFRGGLRGPNLRGCAVSFVRNTNAQAGAPALGSAACIGTSNTVGQAADSCQDCVLGVLDSNMIIGIDTLKSVWVVVCVYGWMDRICTDGTIVSNDDYLVMQEDQQASVQAIFGADSQNRGLLVGYSRPAAQSTRKLNGVLVITLKTPLDTETIVVNMDGTASTAGTGGDSAWGSPPGLSKTVILDQTGTHDIPKGDAPIIAYRTSKSPQTPPETVTGGSGIPQIVEGFVMCMGLSKSI